MSPSAPSICRKLCMCLLRCAHHAKPSSGRPRAMILPSRRRAWSARDLRRRQLPGSAHGTMAKAHPAGRCATASPVDAAADFRAISPVAIDGSLPRLLALRIRENRGIPRWPRLGSSTRGRSAFAPAPGTTARSSMKRPVLYPILQREKRAEWIAPGRYSSLKYGATRSLNRRIERVMWSCGMAGMAMRQIR
jgi:hypothetical protein